MKTISFITVVAGLSRIVSGLPSTETAQSVGKKFLLKTVAVNGDKYDDMYVIPAHTFAGGNVPGVFENKKDAVPAYLNNTSLYFTYGNKNYDQYPFALYSTDYAAAWYECRIDIDSKPIKGFVVSENNLLITTFYGKNKAAQKAYDREFHGAYWRVCKWTHGYPELFFNNPYSSNNEDPTYVPPNCGLVNLQVVPA